jgi:hypothetical protein
MSIYRGQSLDQGLTFAYNGSVKRGSFGIRKESALDAFKLFYEELTATKSANRIKRRRPTNTAK